MENWVIQEMESLDVGDIRLERRVKRLLSILSRSPKESIPVSCQTWSETKVAYRCFSSEKISVDKIMDPHKKQIIERTQQVKRVLMLQDTTELGPVIKCRYKRVYSTYFKMHTPIQQKARTVSLSLSLPVHLEVY